MSFEDASTTAGNSYGNAMDSERQVNWSNVSQILSFWPWALATF
jgi:hypothetical protein